MGVREIQSVAFERDRRGDAWLEDSWLASSLWYARLSDGQVVVMDDGHPDRPPPRSAWLRLAAYLVSRPDLSIVSFWCAFRDQVVRPVPDGAPGYFFRHMALGTPGSPTTFAFFLMGHLLDDLETVRVQTWKVPELQCEEVELRDAADVQLVGPALIRNTTLEGCHDQ